MKLSLSLLSVLQTRATSNAQVLLPQTEFGSADNAGFFHTVGACTSVSIPYSAFSAVGYESILMNGANSICRSINAEMYMLERTDMFGVSTGEMGVRLCSDTCSVNGLNISPPIFSGHSFGPDDDVCFDLCMEINGMADLSGDGEFSGDGDFNLKEEDRKRVKDFVSGVVTKSIVNAVNKDMPKDSRVFLKEDDVGVDVFDITAEDTTDDTAIETPDVPDTTNGTDGGDTATATEEDPTSFPGSDVIGMTVGFSMYFPALWLIHTMFDDITSFCEVFSKTACAPINDESINGSCWIESCDALCYSNGDATDDDASVFTGDFDDSANSHVTSFWSNSMNNEGSSLFQANGDIDSDVANIKKNGCFSAIMTVHLDSTAASAIQAQRDTVIFPDVDATLTNTGLRNYMIDYAKKGVRDAVLEGPANWSESPIAHRIAHGGYQCEDSNANDKVCLKADTRKHDFIGDNEGLLFAQAAGRFAEQTKAGLSGINCNVNNGGCSHVCDGAGLDGTCSCPNECWDLQTDSLTCKIGENRYELICHSDRMEAHLAKCVVRGMSQFRLGNSDCTEDTTVEGLAANMLEFDDHFTRPAITSHGACRPSVDGTNTAGTDEGCLRFITKLDECSMQVDANYVDNELVFLQELVTTDFNVAEQDNHASALALTSQNSAMINFDPRVSVDFTCKYTADYTTEEAGVQSSPDSVTKHLISNGLFAYSLKTIDMRNPDNTMVDLETETDLETQHSTSGNPGDAYLVGSTLTFSICDSQDLKNVYFSVPECIVSSDDEEYKIITDYCPDTFVNTEFVGRSYNGFNRYWKEGDLGVGPNLDDDALIPLPVDPTGQVPTLNQFSLSATHPGKTNLATNECLYFSYTVFEFVTNASEKNDLRLTCKVKACEYSVEDPLAMAACVDDSACGSGRRRRRTPKNERYTTISQRIRVVNNH